MAKSPLVLKSGQARNLELDFLRLVFAVERLSQGEDTAHGYLAVIGPKVVRRCGKWREKYAASERITILEAELTAGEAAKLNEEKERNRTGILPGADQGAKGLSNASIGKKLGEDYLRREIRRREPEAVDAVPEGDVVPRINWDYYGQVT